MTDHAAKMNRELDYLGDLSFEAGQVSIEMSDEQAAKHGVHAVRIARLASLIIAMDDKKLETLLRGAGEAGSATAMFRRLADSFASEANIHEKRASMMNDSCGRLLVVMDRISIADAAEEDASGSFAQDFDSETTTDFAESIENQIVVEIDRGLRSVDLTPAETMMMDNDGTADPSAAADTEPR
jgi:hypothetical protein